jgi:hypothetical protein
VPLRVIPERGKVAENGSHSPSKQRCDVLHDDVSGSYFANDPSELVPKTGPLSCESSSFSCNADVLAGEAAADEIDGPISVAGREGSHVTVARHVGPVLGEDAVGIVINLHPPLAGHAGTFKAEIEAADPCEERAEGHGHPFHARNVARASSESTPV